MINLEAIDSLICKEKPWSDVLQIKQITMPLRGKIQVDIREIVPRLQSCTVAQLVLSNLGATRCMSEVSSF